MRFKKTLKALILSSVGLAIGGCAVGDETGGIATKTQNLTSTQSRVLGFESPTADWQSSSGSISASSSSSEGSSALSWSSSGYTQITSIPIEAPGQAKSMASYDLQLPTTLGWGTAGLVAKIPSQGLYWSDLGTVNLGGMSPGTYHTIDFAVPGNVQAALNSGATDISFVVVLNAQWGAGNFLVDNLSVSEVIPGGSGGSSGDGDGDGDGDVPTGTEIFSFSVPNGTDVGELLLSGTENLTIDSRCTLGEPGTLSTVSSGGPAPSEFAASVKGYVNIISQGDVELLQSQTHIYGDITTGGTVKRQDNSVVVDGVTTEGTTIPLNVSEWQVEWPLGAGEEVTRWASSPPVTLDPGHYGAVHIYSNSAANFRSGRYFFDSLAFEPQAFLNVDTSNGPVEFYVKNSLNLNVEITYTAGPRGHVLIGYLGTDAPYFREAIVATVVAPNSTIELRRPNEDAPHEGAFYGKSIHCNSHATIKYLGFDLDFLFPEDNCPTGEADFDGDDVPDCEDPCWNNADKVEEGVCGCLKADIDTDGDGIPNCEDGNEDDPESVFTGSCYENDGSGNLTPVVAGKPCHDGICSGRQSCDGTGHCGDPESCKPDPSCHYIYANSTDKFYWICDREVTRQQAVDICDSIPGSKLARIPTSGIGHLIKDNASTSLWIGANAIDTSGEWRWRTYVDDAGTQFWKDGATGKSVYARYNEWASSPADSAQCAYLTQSADWVATSCAESHGFVCDVSNDRLGTTIIGDGDSGDGDSGDGDSGDGDGGGNGSGIGDGTGIRGAGDIMGIPPYVPVVDCVSEEEAFGIYDDEAAIVAKFNACIDCQAVVPSIDCSSDCDGPASPPTDPDGTCEWNTSEWAISDSHPTSCSEGKVLALATDDGGNTIDCNSTKECVPEVTDTPCGEDLPPCTGANERCGGQFCMVELLCDLDRNKCVIPDPDCGGDESFPEACVEIEICEADVEPGPDELLDGQLQEIPATPEDFFGTEPVEPELPETFPADECDVEDCGAITGTNHPWCKVDLTDNEDIVPRSDGDDSTGGGNKDEKIRFYFDPIFGFSQTAEIGVLGIPEVALTAQAGVGAGVQLGFAGNPDFKLIDAYAGLSATECGFSSEARLFLFGKDLIAAVDSDKVLPLELPSADTQLECQELLTKIRDAADRVKKALHDTTELLRQYKELRLDGKTFQADLCRVVAAPGSLPRGFPDGYCPMDTSLTTETPEETLQRFIDYYVATIQGFGDKKASEFAFSLRDYIAEFAAMAKDGLPNPGAEFTLYEYAKIRETVIFSTQFFIGPIPAFIELGSTMDFGIDLNARVGLRLGDLAVEILDFTSTDTDPVEVAYAGLAGNPYAGAGIYLFAGVGFGIPGFKIQLGIQGDIHIGTVYVPAYAGAGLYIGATADDRGVPDNFADFAKEGGYLIPPRVYSIQAGYTAGLEARLRDLVSGSVAAKLKLKILFFSKTWKKTLLRFPGFCRQSDNESDGSQPGCDFPIFSAQGELIAAEGELGWGQFKMPITFPELSLEGLLADIEDELSGVVPLNGASSSGSSFMLAALADDEEAFDPEAGVHELFFDSQCKTCIYGGFGSRPEEDCFSASECCGQSICYMNTAGETANRKECRSCVSVEDEDRTTAPDNEGCNTDADCCAAYDDDTGEEHPAFCGPGRRCVSGDCNAPCSGSADCLEGYRCTVEPFAPFDTSCQLKDPDLNQGDYELCNPPIIIKLQ